MPINGVLDLQRRSLQIGEIRIGTSRAIEGKKGRQPIRLDTFRFTVGSQATADAVAQIYGGKAAPWSERKGMWEVITDRTELQVWVPPRGEAVDSWMEAWDGPRCLARCDGFTMTRPERRPCMCPQPDDPADPASVDAARAERMRLAALRPPQACKPITRIHVSITELPGALGVFKLATASENTAIESGDQGDLLALAREQGIYLPAIVRISWRTRIGDGKPYPVLAVQIGASLKEIARGELPAGPAGLLRALAPPVAAVPGLPAGRERQALPAGTAEGTKAPAEAPATAPELPVTDDGYLEPWQRAQQIADAVTSARTPQEVTALAERAKSEGVIEEHYRSDKATDTWEPLRGLLEDEYRKRARGAA